ncbi:MAG: hypothetical protein GVY28_14485, partial [Alphaproteobacteria bacterium]|nr:hypothetical protein [Alphaproteobacteria bacterium]
AWGSAGILTPDMLCPLSTSEVLSTVPRVLIQRDTRLPLVAMRWYQLGGLLADRPGREGVAHAAAQMMIKGAGDRSADEIAGLVESTGSRLNTDSGNNTLYATALSLTDHWQDIAALLSDVVRRPTFPAGEWEKMKPRLLAEIDAINDRWSRQMFCEFEQAFYGDHPWSRMPVGRRDVVQALDAHDLAAFHRRHLSATDSVLAIVGDVDVERAGQRVAELFGELPEQAAEPVHARAPEPTPPAVHVRQIAKPLTAVQIGFGPAVERASDRWATMLVLNRIVSSFPGGWLHQALRGEGPGLVYAAFAFQRSGVVPGYWAMAFNTSADSAPEAIDRAMQVAQRLRERKVDDATLERAINAALVSEFMGRQTAGQRATGAALDELYGAGYRDGELLIERIGGTGAADVRALARQLLDRPVIMILSDTEFDASVIETLDRQHTRPAAGQVQAP